MEVKNFRHHQDGIIFIYDGKIQFQCTLEEFLMVEPDYSLPEFFIGREYFQGKYHRLYTAKNEIYLDDGEVWTEGDIYISKIEQYLESLSISA